MAGGVARRPLGRVCFERNGRFETYVRPLPSGDGKWQVSANGGNAPVWAPDGRELYFGSAGAFWSASIQQTPTFRIGVPRRLFDLRNSTGRRYSVSPDNQRFLVVGDLDSGENGRVIVSTNWIEELKGKVSPH